MVPCFQTRTARHLPSLCRHRRECPFHGCNETINRNSRCRREAADDVCHSPFPHWNCLRRGVTPYNGFGLSIDKLRRDGADDLYIPTMVYFFQLLDIAAQHVCGLDTGIFKCNILEQRLGPNPVYHKLCDGPARIRRPTMKFIESDFRRGWTVDEPAFAKILRTLKFPDDERSESIGWRRDPGTGRREVQDIVRGIANMSAAAGHECREKHECQQIWRPHLFHCGTFRSGGCVVRMRFHGRCLIVSLRSRRFSEVARRFRTVSANSCSFVPTTWRTPASSARASCTA